MKQGLAAAIKYGWNLNASHCLSHIEIEAFVPLCSQAPPEYLLSAAVMSAPAAIAVSKLNWPETEESITKKQVDIKLDKGFVFVCLNLRGLVWRQTKHVTLRKRCHLCTRSSTVDSQLVSGSSI